MLISFQDNPCFNYIVDHNLCTLIEKQISLKEYFENSQLPIYKIKDFSWKN